MIIHLLAVISPGPDFAIVIRQCFKYGRNAAIYTSLGIASGITIHILYCIVGFSFLSSNEFILKIFKIIGTFYLCFIGIISIIKSNDSKMINLQDNEKEKIYNNLYKKSFVLGFITNVFNPWVDLDYSSDEFVDEGDKQTKGESAGESLIEERKFEFLSVDDTLDGIDLSDYTDFMATFSTESTYVPQIVLLTEILNNNGASVVAGNVKTFHDTFMSSVLETMAADVAANEAAFKYGAMFDSLAKEDVEYVTEEDGTDYYEAEVDDGDGGTRTIRNNDMILGISSMQYKEENEGGPKNRVFYLDPAQYGGSYMNPPLYIAPLENEGWLGFVDVMFPEISTCKPQRTDLIDFEDIQDRIDEVYPNLPEDERLKSFNLGRTVREKRINKEKQLQEEIDQTYKKDFDKVEQEKMTQLLTATRNIILT